MNRVAGVWIASVACVAGGCATAPTLAPPSDGASADPMFRFAGAWEGSIETFAAPRIDAVPYDVTARFVIADSGVAVYFRENDIWRETKRGHYKIERWQSQAVISSITSGRDEDGRWVESSTFTLVHDTPATLLVYWIRTVRNLDLSSDNPEAAGAVGGSGRFHLDATGNGR